MAKRSFPSSPIWSLYMIRCADNSLYTGISPNVEKRFAAHQETGQGGAKYLRGRGPLELVFQRPIGSKSMASKAEYRVKKLSKAQKERLIQKALDFDAILTTL